jgi:hypothetical protein
MNRRKLFSSLAVAAILARAAMRRARAAETNIDPEVSLLADIPDDQAFITFTSPAGFTIKVPEGWALHDGGRETAFSDKYNRIALFVASAPRPFDLAYATSTLAPEIEKMGKAVHITEIAEMRLRTGRTVKIAYDADSEPDEITSKRVRQENELFYFVRKRQLVMLNLTTPKGADNVDQWRLIASSFRWT